ncbi:MAG: glycoside hydrolase family 3 N-terminal domain-containing protein [Coleofasciculus sp. G1-WW12-02]|uniref:glycoside hydrolase family 3 N-terminal domain-containing protein n=1 Tax=Coleofasciculus sp. G1-WW12-02 TaxID=3068483 RepID=UPI0032F1D16A
MNSLPDIQSLSLAQQVAQMVVVRASGYLFDHQIQYPAWEPPAARLQHWIQDWGVGGVILLGASAGELALRSQQLQEYAQIPLLIAADIEEGVGQRFAGATWFAPPMAIGAIARQDLQKAQNYAKQKGAITAQEALAIGINWILAPVVDVNNNPQNPVINVRAYGETPEIVSQLACQFIRGTQDYPVLTTAKHFPGHGDTAIDSHLDLPILSHSRSRMAQVEFPPFQAAMAAGVDAVMTAHLLIPSLDDHYPATLSQKVLTQVLRQELGFEGLIVTDALIMGAITNRYGATEAPVKAVEAGADILLMPVNPETAIQAVCDAVAAGRISRDRILASVERIWQAKAKISQGTQVSGSRSDQAQPLSFLGHLAQPTAIDTVTNILRDSQQVGGSLPLRSKLLPNSRQGRNLIIVDDILTCDVLGRNAPAVTLPQQFGYQLQWVDCHTPPMLRDHNERPIPTLLQLFIRGNPFRSTASLTAVAADWLQRLLTDQVLEALVIYGSPYTLEQFLPDLPAQTPYVYSYGQMPEAQAIALEVLFDQIECDYSLTEFI